MTTKKRVFLHGDFNVNLLICNANSNTLTNTITALRHVCTIICLSCTTNLSNSLLDLCITNSNNFVCEILIYDINDQKVKFVDAVFKIRNVNKNTLEIFQQKKKKSLALAGNSFTKLLVLTLCITFPIILFSPHTMMASLWLLSPPIKKLQKLWMSWAILKKIHKDKLFAQFIKTKHPGDFRTFKKYQNILKTWGNPKELYYCKWLEDSSTKKTWSLLADMVHTRTTILWPFSIKWLFYLA